MFLCLTDLEGNLVLINADKIDAIFLDRVKGKTVTKIGLSNGCYLTVQETVSRISLWLLDANRIVS